MANLTTAMMTECVFCSWSLSGDIKRFAGSTHSELVPSILSWAFAQLVSWLSSNGVRTSARCVLTKTQERKSERPALKVSTLRETRALSGCH